MRLCKKIVFTSLFATLLPVVSLAQTPEMSAARTSQTDLISYWVNNNESALRAELEGYSLSWGSYVLSLVHESEEATAYSALFHAFTADFAGKYGVSPQQASIALLQDYYAKRKNDYGGELLLPTMAIWHKRPLLSIVPLPDRLDAFWGNPDQAGDTYDFMAAIDRDDTFYFMSSYMGAFFGHPDSQKDLKTFWKHWQKRSDNSAAKQDILSLKRAILAEILSHDPSQAVYELASKATDLWPQLYVDPATAEEQTRVQAIISSVCLQEEPTENCARFVNYANRYGYTSTIAQDLRTRVSNTYYNGTWNVGIYYDDTYYNSWLHHRRWRVDEPFLWPYDPWYPDYYWSGIYFSFYDPRPYVWAWYWHRPPVIIHHGGHRPPHVHHGHRPPAVHPGGHRPGHHPGGRPGHRPGGNGHKPGGQGGHSHNPGANPGHHPGGQGGHGNHPGGHNGDNGGHGHNPGGHNGDNGNPGHGNNGGHNPGGNDNPGSNPPAGGDNGSHGGHRGGHGLVDRTHTAITREHISPEVHTRVDARHEATRMSSDPTNGSGRHSGFSGNRDGNFAIHTPHRPSNEVAHRTFGRSSFTHPDRPAGGFSGAAHRPSAGHSSVSAPSRSSNGHAGASAPHRPSNEAAHRTFGGNSFGGANHTSGGSHRGGFSGSRGGGFSGSHGSHGGGHGGRHR